MVKKMIALVTACLLLAGGFGCGGSGNTLGGDEASGETEYRVDKLRDKEEAGLPLSAKEARMLDEADAEAEAQAGAEAGAE